MQQGTGVVVGYDGSGRARSALLWAAREAAHRDLPLRLVRAIPYAAAPDRGRASALEGRTLVANHVLDEGIQLARTLLGEDQVSGACIIGHPAGVLAGASEHAALVVVGQRSQDGPVSSAVGSTSLVLADQACCPVVVARGASGPERAGLPVVVGVTGASSQSALDFAAYTAQIRSVPLTIVVAWSLPPAREWSRGAHGYDTVAQWARELSAQAAAAANASEEHVRQHYPTVATRTRVDPLESAVALVRASRGAGLVVVGLGGRTASRSEGSASVRGLDHQVAQAVLGRAACPVVVVPDGAATTDEVAVAGSDGGAEDNERSAG